MVDALGSIDNLRSFALILVGIPKAMHQEGEKQLDQFKQLFHGSAPIVPYRKFTGEFSSASALATAFAVSFFASGAIPGAFTGGRDIGITKETNKILILALGEYLAAIELCRP